MKLLQGSLAGKDLTVLYRDPAAQRDAWAKALGPRLGKVELWPLPMRVVELSAVHVRIPTVGQAPLRILVLQVPRGGVRPDALGLPVRARFFAHHRRDDGLLLRR